MAVFKIAYSSYIQPFEGGYVNHPADRGGETYAGIARNIYPNLTLWGIIDEKKKQFPNGIIPRNTKFPELSDYVEDFFLGVWNKNNIGSIKHQMLANLLFDFIVHSGSKNAVKPLQRLVGVNDDGVIGQKTLQAINNADGDKLYLDLLEYRKQFLNNIVARDTSQSVFLKGWMNRIDKFYQDYGKRLASFKWPLVILIFLIVFFYVLN